MGTAAADAAAAAAAAENNNKGGAGGADDAAAKAAAEKAAGDKAAADKAAADKAAADKAAADAAAAGNETPEQKAAREKADADKKAADEKAAAAAGNVVPDKYDLKLPDKSNIDKAVVERTAAIARELGLSQERAQKMLDFQVQELAAIEDATIKATLEAHQPGGAVWEKQVEEWNAKALADPDIGGNKPEQLQASVKLAKQVVAKFGDKESIEFLEKNPLGSHPALIRLLYRIGKASSEGSLVLASAQDTSKKPSEEILYPVETAPDWDPRKRQQQQ